MRKMRLVDMVRRWDAGIYHSLHTSTAKPHRWRRETVGEGELNAHIAHPDDGPVVASALEESHFPVVEALV